jgi:hypothetical protein
MKFISEDTNAIHTIITTRKLTLNEIKFGNYLQKKTKAPSKVVLGFQIDRAS